MGWDLESEIDERMESGPLQKCQHDKSYTRKRRPKCVRSVRERIFLVARFQQQVHDKQRYGEKAQHEEYRGVFALPREIGQPRQKLGRSTERGCAKECQGQAEDVAS